MTTRALPVKTVFLLILATLAWPLSAQTSAPTDPVDELTKMLQDPRKASEVLTALRATDDKDLAAFYTALATGGNKDWRVFAMGALADAAGKDAAATFSDRVKNDPSMVVRTEGLLALIALKLATPDELAAVLAMPDENLQCIAARTLVVQGQKLDLAKDALTKLVSSKDIATAAMSRLSLLGLGQKEHAEPLQAIFKDAHASPDVLSILLEQIAEEKIVPGAAFAQIIAQSDHPWQLRLRAYRALSAVAPDAVKLLTDAIAASSQTVYRVHLLRVLVIRKDAAAALDELAKGDDAIAVLAKFEKARAAGGDEASKAALEVAKLGHPVVIDYLLDRTGMDIKEKGTAADAYVPALLLVIQSVSQDPQDIKKEHLRAARAATLLADMPSPKALDAVKMLLRGKYSAVTRVMATGLLRSSNKDVCDLARPLLKSPYEELATDAGLLLGKFGDKDAKDFLESVTNNADKHSTLLLTMAYWYRIKIAGQGKAAAQALVKAVK